MRDSTVLIKLIKSYTIFEWLVFIKVLENKSDDEINRLEPNQLQRFNIQNTNWYSKIVDLAIRIADDKILKVNLNRLPTNQDYHDFIRLYVNSIDESSTLQKDLDFDLHFAFSKLIYEQLKNYQPIANDLGRLLLLYRDQEELFKQLFGLTPKQIIYFYTFVSSQHSILEPFNVHAIQQYLYQYDTNISTYKLDKFLNFFSITIKQYRLWARENGITNKTIKCKRLIERSPIIQLGYSYYFIPSKDNLLHALTYRIFETLNSQQKNPQNFKRNFGESFEKYVRKLTTDLHNSFYSDCSEIIREDGQEKAEFFLLKNNVALIIEAKLIDIDEEIILHQPVEEFKEKLNNTIEKALKQIKSCFDNICAKKKYGIIVIHTHVPVTQNLIHIFKKSHPKYSDLNITIMSIIDYEIFIDNPFDEIISYLELEEKSQIPLYFDGKTRNEFLGKKYLDLIDEVSKNYESVKGH